MRFSIVKHQVFPRRWLPCKETVLVLSPPACDIQPGISRFYDQRRRLRNAPSPRSMKEEDLARSTGTAWNSDARASRPVSNRQFGQLSGLAMGSLNGLGKVGEPGRTRTSNPLIKSQLLYH